MDLVDAAGADAARAHPGSPTFPPEFAHPTNIFCVTLYNERRSAFEKTIVSLLVAIREFHGRAERGTGHSLLCIVADGRGKMDPAILEALRRWGFITDCGQRSAAAELHAGSHAWDTLAQDFALPQLSGLDHPQPLRVVVCLKDCNSGKLHSHEFFFDTVCRALQPTYCYQIDTGTTLEPGAVTKIVDRMELSPDCAALALRILPARPEPGATFLSTWQYLDCALQKCVLWPFEMASGHLSVVPGQACVFRWRALHGIDSEPEPGASAGALGRYLRGLQANRPLERVMYLAEDRVIGSEIVLTQGTRWRLGYAVEAGAVTDSCATPGELFRQRRRWRNSAMACRLWMLSRWPTVLGRADRGGIGKGMFTVAMTAQMLLLILDLVAPAQLVALLKVLYAAVARSPYAVAACVYTGLFATIALTVMEVGLPLVRQSRLARRPWTWGRRLACLCLSAALLYALVTSLPAGACLILLAAPALALVTVRLVLPGASLSVAARAPIFAFAELLMVSALSLYALWNFHDISWGTKGLRRSEAEPGLRRGLHSWRNVLLSGWLLANATLIASTLSFRGMVFPSMSPVLAITCVANAVIAALSLCYLLRHRVMLTAMRARLGALTSDFGTVDSCTIRWGEAHEREYVHP